ncbi:MAG: diacylglyceryl transferase [Rhodocyclaceae bacterium]|nr:diacylglyceryl transferase [Rhodocyclaceae bacterium]
MIRDPATAQAVHSFFEAAAMLAGGRYYWALRRRGGQPSMLHGAGFAVLLGCVLGAAIGNKVVFWIEMPHLWAQYGGWPGFFLMGQSMVGGLLGGLIGVEVAKKLAGWKPSTGDLFVFPLLLALIVGRVGCFLAGLNDGTHGSPTDLPWGMDFGDGIPRHPAPLYEILFAAGLWWLLARWRQRLAAESGLLFKLFLAAYLFWRFTIDFLKPVPYAYPLGLSGIQWVCVVALALYLPLLARQLRKVFP